MAVLFNALVSGWLNDTSEEPRATAMDWIYFLALLAIGISGAIVIFCCASAIFNFPLASENC